MPTTQWLPIRTPLSTVTSAATTCGRRFHRRDHLGVLAVAIVLIGVEHARAEPDPGAAAQPQAALRAQMAAVQERIGPHAQLRARERHEPHRLGLAAQPGARADLDPRVAPRDHDQPARRAIRVHARPEHHARARLECVAARGQVRARAGLEHESGMECTQARDAQAIPTLNGPKPERPQSGYPVVGF